MQLWKKKFCSHAAVKKETLFPCTCEERNTVPLLLWRKKHFSHAAVFLSSCTVKIQKISPVLTKTKLLKIKTKNLKKETFRTVKKNFAYIFKQFEFVKSYNFQAET